MKGRCPRPLDDGDVDSAEILHRTAIQSKCLRWKDLFWTRIPVGALDVGFRGARYFAPGIVQARSRHGFGAAFGKSISGRFTRPAQRSKGKVVSLQSGA